jgi:hypothetical protein
MSGKLMFYILVLFGAIVFLDLIDVLPWLPDWKPTWDEVFAKDPTDPRRL